MGSSLVMVLVMWVLGRLIIETEKEVEFKSNRDGKICLISVVIRANRVKTSRVWLSLTGFRFEIRCEGVSLSESRSGDNDTKA